ncbi:hypothetical protein GmHk_13G036585 [Glycine max]|nr:hypothetical protein GmHk_13G036585 [Glycine max]
MFEHSYTTVMDDWSSSLGMVRCMDSSSFSPYTMQRIDALNVNITFKHRAHWQLVVLCPKNDVVVWLCSLRKKPDIHIKVACNEDLKTTVDGKTDQVGPQWIEVKSHVQSGGYECGYYWFGDGTPLDVETITTLHNKWTTYFVKVQNTKFRKV